MIQCTSKLKTWHEETREEAKEWIDEINSLSIMVTGRTGSAVNALYTCCDHANVTNELLNVMVVSKNARAGLYARLCNLGCKHGTESVYALPAFIGA